MKSTLEESALRQQIARTVACGRRRWLVCVASLALPFAGLTVRGEPAGTVRVPLPAADSLLAAACKADTNTWQGTNSLEPVIEWTDSDSNKESASRLPCPKRLSCDEGSQSIEDRFGRGVKSRLGGDISLDGEGGMLWNAARPVRISAAPGFLGRDVAEAIRPVSDLIESDSRHENTPVSGWLSPLHSDLPRLRGSETAAGSPGISSSALDSMDLPSVSRIPGAQVETPGGNDLLFDPQELTGELLVSESQPPEPIEAVWRAYPEVSSIDVPPIPEAGAFRLALFGALVILATSGWKRRGSGAVN